LFREDHAKLGVRSGVTLRAGVGRKRHEPEKTYRDE
jgi:hypothetical protein